MAFEVKQGRCLIDATFLPQLPFHTSCGVHVWGGMEKEELVTYHCNSLSVVRPWLDCL